ncbi:MAG: lysophospholipid acyltransferase family protein [Gemmatimonadaceae bacterium]
MNVPPLGPSVPRRGNAVSRFIGRSAMSLTGWKFEGVVPDEPKFVIIVAPHTSNWDFPLGVMALFSLGFRVSFLGKHTIFKWPLGIFMRWLGGIPVERSIRRDRVVESIAAFNAADKLILAIAPEGTRKLVPKWKTGFYHVAHGARVPIVPVVFDFGRRVIGICPPFFTTGDMDADMPRIKQYFVGAVAKHPRNFKM